VPFISDGIHLVSSLSCVVAKICFYLLSHFFPVPDVFGDDTSVLENSIFLGTYITAVAFLIGEVTII